MAANRAFDNEKEETEAELSDEDDEQDMRDVEEEMEPSNVTISLEQVTVTHKSLNAKIVIHQ